MSCPSEIAEIILQILRTGILRIRSAGWSDDANRCALEADHIHNLPHLLEDYSAESLKFYWETERVAFMHQIPAAELGCFVLLWSQLAPHTIGTTEKVTVT